MFDVIRDMFARWFIVLESSSREFDFSVEFLNSAVRFLLLNILAVFESKPISAVSPFRFRGEKSPCIRTSFVVIFRYSIAEITL